MSLPFRCSRIPWIIEQPVSLLARMLYRLKPLGVERVPAEGGALLLANHLSYVDAVLLQLACPRPIRFVGYSGVPSRHWVLRVAFQLSGTIPISRSRPLEATRRVVEALKAGELVLLFPEGAISRTGQLMKLERGFEVMARTAGVPVVPVAHDGLWSSVFSYSEGKMLFKSPRLMRTHVCVTWGEPIPPEKADVATVRRALLDLGEQAFGERPQLKRHLGREAIRRLARDPLHIELIDRTADRRPLRAGSLLAAAAALSRRLRRIVASRRVGVVLPPGAGATIANLAIVCAGKVPVNLNFTAGRAALESSMRIAGVDTVISANAMRGKLPQFPWPERTLDLKSEFAAMGGKRAVLPWLLAAWLLPNQLIALLLGLPRRGDREEAGLLFTSGSAGEPKGVVLTHRNILANCWQISSLSILPQSCVMLGCLPIFHSFGFTVTVWYPLLRGCRVVTVPSPLDTKRIIDTISEEELTVMVGAPTFLRPILRKAEPHDLRSLEVVICGAEKMPMDLFEAFAERFHIEIMQGYGLTETSPVTNVNQPSPPPPSGDSPEQAGMRIGAVGRMMPGLTARIVDPDTKADLPASTTGLVAFRGANVFGGYLDDAEKTAAAFHDGWFVTGDLGRFDEDGFLFIEGRLSRFSKIAGEMVPHGTVEQALIKLYGLDAGESYPLVITGVPDAAKGEALVLLTTHAEVTLDDVRAKLTAAGMPNLWVPRTLLQVERIPVLATGKLDIAGCRNLALAAVKPAA